MTRTHKVHGIMYAWGGGLFAMQREFPEVADFLANPDVQDYYGDQEADVEPVWIANRVGWHEEQDDPNGHWFEVAHRKSRGAAAGWATKGVAS